jgi:hypothetical protein
MKRRKASRTDWLMSAKSFAKPELRAVVIARSAPEEALLQAYDASLDAQPEPTNHLERS